MGRRMFAGPAVLVAAMLAAGIADRAGAQEIAGVWSGTADQNSGSSGYTVVLNFDTGEVTTDYPDLDCGGSLTRVGASNGYVFYTEAITYGGIDSGGQCIDGTVTIRPMDSARLMWGWVGAFEGEVYVAWSMLARH